MAEANKKTTAAETRMSRRRVVGMAATGAGVAAVSIATQAVPATATTGAMQYGTSNNAGADSTSLNVVNSTEGLYVNNNGTGAGIRVFAHPQAPNPALAVYSQGNGPALHVFTLNNTNGGGIFTEISNPASPAAATRSFTAGLGWAMYGRVNNTTSTFSAVFGRTSGSGAGIEGWSAKGVGGKFAGSVAQVRLVASGKTSHPPTGTRGDLFVDKFGRLWFCKGGATWTQLA